jgi:hypothetical protein
MQDQEKFFWNHKIYLKACQKFSPRIKEFCLTTIQGFYQLHRVLVRGKILELEIISRRDTGRVGPRFHSRGIDEKGNTSNFVETEQILRLENEVLAIVQLRGSMPFYWGQEINIRYTPERRIYEDALEPYTQHMSELISTYGKIILINLINKNGYEGVLEKEFFRYVGEMDDSRIRYIHFDFHAECSKMRWENIGKLTSEIRPDLKEQGFTRISNGNYLRVQTSVNRVNCMDCLDRTNVVQSEIAKLSLESQLMELGILQIGESLEFLPELNYVFKNCKSPITITLSMGRPCRCYKHFLFRNRCTKNRFYKNGKKNI